MTRSLYKQPMFVHPDEIEKGDLVAGMPVRSTFAHPGRVAPVVTLHFQMGHGYEVPNDIGSMTLLSDRRANPQKLEIVRVIELDRSDPMVNGYTELEDYEYLGHFMMMATDEEVVSFEAGEDIEWPREGGQNPLRVFQVPDSPPSDLESV